MERQGLLEFIAVDRDSSHRCVPIKRGVDDEGVRAVHGFERSYRGLFIDFPLQKEITIWIRTNVDALGGTLG